jgi:hypothetical protein
VVSDSCYSGALTRNVSVQGLDAVDIVKLSQKRARTVFSSGGLEPVVDSGGAGHSVFAKAFLDSLQSSADVVVATTLFATIRSKVLLNADQTPEYSNIRSAGHDGGDFIFSRRR